MADEIHALPRIERFGDRTVDADRYTDPDILSLEYLLRQEGWTRGAPMALPPGRSASSGPARGTPVCGPAWAIFYEP